MFKRLTLLTLLLVAAVAVTLTAGEGHGHKKEAQVQKASVEMAGAEVTMKGQLVCLGCSLKTDGAHAACSEFGCSHALKTSEGKYISFLQNKFSKNLMAGHDAHNKDVEVTGVFFANANVLDVTSYKVEEGKTISWCDGCKSMDACAAH